MTAQAQSLFSDPEVPDMRSVATAPDAGRKTRTLRSVSSSEPVANPKYGPTPKDNGFACTDELFFGVPRHIPADPHCPPIEQCRNFQFNEDLKPAIRNFVIGQNIFLIGPPGSGKTLMARWLANQLGVNLYSQSHNAHTQADELGVQLVQGADGQWHHVLGKILTAYKFGGIILLDELLACKDAGVGKFYYPFLNRDPVTVQTDDGLETIYPHPEFRVIATGNPWTTVGGNYEVGEALADRFVFIECGFLPAEQEIALLIEDGPGVGPGDIRDLVTFANRTREAAKNSATKAYSLSTRVLRSLVQSMEHAGNSLAEVVEMHIMSTLRVKYPDQYDSIRAIFEDVVTVE